jgi:hypothetical protein
VMGWMWNSPSVIGLRVSQTRNRSAFTVGAKGSAV